MQVSVGFKSSFGARPRVDGEELKGLPHSCESCVACCFIGYFMMIWLLGTGARAQCGSGSPGPQVGRSDGLNHPMAGGPFC